MSARKILTANEIIDKKFSGNSSGYDALEVDQFFDEIIYSLTFLENEIIKSTKNVETLKTEIAVLKGKILDLDLERIKLTNRIAEFDGKKEATMDNINLLNRIKALESALYALGVNPTKIK